MPSFRFAGLTAAVYPEGRDAEGRNIGQVEPGDVRPFDEAPDHMWVPAEDGSETEPETAVEPEPTAPEPEPAPDGPQPAPPAVIPGA